MIQVIDKQNKSYNLLINDVSLIFIPMSLFIESKFLPLMPQVHKSKGYLFWVVNKKQVSYNQIKKAINEFNNSKRICKIA